eukprot:sb/3471041/
MSEHWPDPFSRELWSEHWPDSITNTHSLTLNIASYCCCGVTMGLWCRDISLINSLTLSTPSLFASTVAIISSTSLTLGFRPIVAIRVLNSSTEIEPSPFMSYLLNACSYSLIWSMVRVTGCSVFLSSLLKRQDFLRAPAPLPPPLPLLPLLPGLLFSAARTSCSVMWRLAAVLWVFRKFLVESRNFLIRVVI